MSRARAFAAALAVALLGLIALSAPSHAADAQQVKSLQVVGQAGRVVNLLAYLDPQFTPAAGATVTSKVNVANVEAPSTAQLVQDQAKAGESILVLDVSGSMRGNRLESAKAAAENYVKSLPSDVRVGLVTFNDVVTVEVEPTTNRREVLNAIADVQAGQKTALYDGIIGGLDLADQDVQARLLLLSDGGDTASEATLEDVVSRVASDGTPVDVVALTPSVTHADVLEGLAKSSGGQFLLATDAAGLDEAFQEATGSFGGKVAITATIPPGIDASGKFAVVSLGIDDATFVGTTQMPRSADLEGSGTVIAPVPTTPPPSRPLPVTEASTFSSWVYGALAALVVLMLALTIAYSRRQRRAELRTEQVLWYSRGMSAAEGNSRPTSLDQRSFVVWLDEAMSSRESYPKMESKLDNAEMNLTPGSWLFIRVCIGLVLSFILAIIFGFLIGVIAGVLLTWLGTRYFVNSREAKRRKSFETELPDFLLLIASALRSGLSFTQALDSTAADGQGQVARQIRRAMSEVQMGMQIEDALIRVADRMQSEDMRWTVTALAIQREVGGNLSNILETAAATVQSRAELRREVKTLSAEGRLSGWVLAALPVGIFLYMLFANHDYVAFFWQETVGQVMLIVIGVLFIAGWIWMRRVVQIKV